MNKLNERLTLIANLSVVAGIVFLALELQQNTQAIQAQTRDSITEKQMTYLGWRATSPELAAVVAKVRSAGMDSLTDAEFSQWQAYVFGLMREWENSFYQYERGLFTQGEFEARRQGWRNQMSIRPDAGPFRELWANGRGAFAPNFREVIDQIVAEVGN